MLVIPATGEFHALNTTMRHLDVDQENSAPPTQQHMVDAFQSVLLQTIGPAVSLIDRKLQRSRFIHIIAAHWLHQQFNRLFAVNGVSAMSLKRLNHGLSTRSHSLLIWIPATTSAQCCRKLTHKDATKLLLNQAIIAAHDIHFVNEQDQAQVLSWLMLLTIGLEYLGNPLFRSRLKSRSL